MLIYWCTTFRMYKFISNIVMVIVLGLLVVVIAKPDVAQRATDQVLGILAETPTVASLPPTKTEPLAPTGVPSLRNIKAVPAIGGEPASTVSTAALSTNNIVDATNRERLAAGLPPLILNSRLVQSAKIKTDDMIARQYFEHVSPTGEIVSDLGIKVGYDYVVMGENLALGNFINGDDVVAAWMESSGHRENILNPDYQQIGVYAAKGVYEGRDIWFAVQHFGTTRDACPEISTTLKASITKLNADLKKQQTMIAAEKEILEGPDRPRGEEYKTRVAAFNGMVAEYNTALVISQEKIKQYNAQVAAFNTCLVRFQK